MYRLTSLLHCYYIVNKQLRWLRVCLLSGRVIIWLSLFSLSDYVCTWTDERFGSFDQLRKRNPAKDTIGFLPVKIQLNSISDIQRFLKDWTLVWSHWLYGKRDFRFSQRRVWRWLSSGLLHHVVWYKFTNVSEVLAASETSVNFYQTIWHNSPEDSHLHSHYCENLKSHWLILTSDICVFKIKRNCETANISAQYCHPYLNMS
jgi:hypothetical protein